MRSHVLNEIIRSTRRRRQGNWSRVLTFVCLAIAACRPGATPELVAFFTGPATEQAGSCSVLVQGRVFTARAEDAEGRQRAKQSMVQGVHTFADTPDDYAQSLTAEERRRLQGDVHDAADRLQGMGGDEEGILHERLRYLLSPGVSNERVTIRLANRVLTLSPTNGSGYFSEPIALSAADAAQIASQSTLVRFESKNPSVSEGQAVLIPVDGVSVITDMDDTIKDTHVLDRKEMIANTFWRPFKSVDGMAATYQTWLQKCGATTRFHVVSASPWQLYPPLRQFTDAAGFPPFTWHMRSVNTSLEHIGKHLADIVHPDVYAFKVATILPLAQSLPNRTLVLVGDSGEKDPEVYGRVLEGFPNRVAAVFIRIAPGDAKSRPCAGSACAEQKRYRDIFADRIGPLWVFASPGELPALETLLPGKCRAP